MRRRHAPLAILALCLLLSVLGNWGGLELLLTWMQSEPLPEREEITYLDLEQIEQPPLPDDLQDKAKLEEPDKKEKKLKKKKKKKKEKKKPELKFEELPEPEPEKEPEPEPEPEEKPKVDFVLEDMKMVEQPDELDEKESPEDVDFLSNINRDVDQQTRAKVTNLERDAIKPKARQLEKSEVKEQGTAAETVIAQDRDHKSARNKKMPKAKPEPQEERPQQDDPKPKSLLAMREVEKRDHKMAQEAHEALATSTDDGVLRNDQKHQASVEPRRQQARIKKNDKAYKHRLTHKDLDALFGKDTNAQKSYEAKKQSKTKGVWEDMRAHWQSPLENMVPEVQVGNQTALRSRKHPFARYIATMHRAIHEAWAWGYLEQLDTRGRRHPLNDYALWSRVEIVLSSNGTIDKVITVKHSGKTAFDAAAREIVYAAGPFPNPPKEIMSGNGKIYIHWAFHRDERACGTFGAQPFILDGTGRGDRPNARREIRPRSTSGRRLRRGKTAKPRAPRVAEGPSLPPGHAHRRGGAEQAKGAGRSAGQGRAVAPLSPPPTADDLASDPKAKKVANEWLAYFAKGQVDKTVARSTLPFYAGDTIVARTRAELKEILSTMVSEAKGAGRPKAAKVFTAAGLRKAFGGSVPAGVQEGKGRVYGLTKVGSDLVVLMLEKKFGAWRVAGVSR